MDYAVENLEKTSDIERKATLSKLHNMQWLKNTSYSANPDKIKAVVYKQIQNQDEEKKIEDKVTELAETIKIHAVKEPDKYSSLNNMLQTNLFNDTMPEKDENIWNKDIDTANLFTNADNLTDQKNEEDMLSIVESIVTAKLEAEFCITKEHKDQSNVSENNTKDIQDTICTNLSESQKINENTKELKLIKHSDGNNNNDSKSVTLCMSKVNDEQNSTYKIAGVQSSKVLTETNDKGKFIICKICTGCNSNLIKDNEKPSNLSNDSKKAIFNSSKLLSTTDKNGRDHFNNKHKAKNTASIKKQEFVKQRHVSRNGTEKEVKKSNLVKTDFETTDMTCQSKNLNKDKILQKQTKQFSSKLKGQESLKKNPSTPNFFDDKNKTEKLTHISGNLNSPLNESERKNDKIVNEHNFQSDQKVNRSDFRKNTTFVAQYKNSTFSKSMQNVPRTGQAPMYGRNSSYAYNNPKFNKNRNDTAEHKVMKKELTPTNILIKSNTGTEKSDTNNLESCTIQKEEVIQLTDVKSTNVHEVDTLLSNDKSDSKSIKVESYLIQSKENMNLKNKDQGSIMSEQCCEETNGTSKVDISQQNRETNKEDIKPLKHSSNLVSDKCATNSQINAMHQYSFKLENVQRTNDVNQLKSSQITWNQSSDNAMQKGATIMSLQQSIQNMHFNTQQTFTQTGNLRGQMSSWESDNSKFYDQHFPVNDAMRLSQIPNTFNAPPYSNTQMSHDDSVTGTSTLETTMNRENSNVLYRYGPNVQQRPVMASDFPGHSASSCQTNQSRWNSSIQDNFHIEHPYVATQPTMMHIYNPATFGPDDFNNTMDYVSHPVIYAPSPYMQTWNSQLQYSVPVMYNSPCTNYTFPSHNQSNNFNSSMHDQQQKHNPYMQMNNYARDTYNDTNTCAVQARNAVDNVPMKSNYYYKKYQDNCRTVGDVPQYVAPVSYSKSQHGMNFMPATGINQCHTSYCPNQKYYKQNMTNYMKNPKSQVQDFVCDDNASEDIPPIISPKEFVTNNVNFSNQSDQFATRVFKPDFKTRSNSGYRPPPSLPRYNGSFRKNTTFQDFPKDYTYPVSIGRGTYKTKKI
ncbi:PREDICTED: uncharacterized protein MAL13P1.304-like [Cyphomyrmex costatus]|uniref:uncharacterized protein MAL13P1.304-like n=1 Tax=Cyphomyrmex costatus TaxID=456900 RepID=UPI0008523571|nr:PREDICTED: uncharacterized protein MAL13P1.304-like [Cyphomyrmex costatus]